MVKNASEYMRDHYIWSAEKDFKNMRHQFSYLHNSSRWENKSWRNSSLNVIQTHDLVDALPTDLSSQVGAGHVVSL